MKIVRKRWLIDLGNSRLKCALLDAQGRRGEILALGHDQPNALPTLLKHIGATGGNDELWLASVAQADRTMAFVAAAETHGLRVHRIQTQASFGKLRIAYAEPASLGVDRFLAMVAACQRDDGPWLLVSAGSALTIDLLAEDGRHLGGSIAPMPARMRASLAAGFKQLDLAEGHASDFAADTADAIASGCHGAALGLVERSLRKAREHLGAIPTLLVGGGGAALLADVEHAPVMQLPALVLDGMAVYVHARES
ncbi:MAG: type III pantothenate kinase [Gammaproteobacteria bacterium]|nr:type III pantothenate kinase [Gammaproteobacteria bacterium]